MTQRTTFAKLQRERAKKQRAEEKRARRRGEDTVPVTSDAAAPVSRARGPMVPDVAGDGSPLTPDRLLRLVEQLTEAHEAGLLTDDELDEKRAILMSRV